MSWLIAAVFGLAIGLLISFLARPDRRNYIADAATGITGSLIGTWFFGNVLQLGGGITTNLSEISFLGTIWSIIGAAIFVGITQSAISMGEERAARGPAYYEEIRERNRERKEKR